MLDDTRINDLRDMFRLTIKNNMISPFEQADVMTILRICHLGLGRIGYKLIRDVPAYALVSGDIGLDWDDIDLQWSGVANVLLLYIDCEDELMRRAVRATLRQFSELPYVDRAVGLPILTDRKELEVIRDKARGQITGLR